MKLWTLLENTACQPELKAEHGLSLYLETGKHKILFDMGQTDAFWENAAALGIDLKNVDIAVLSHGHYDHGGGLRRFLGENTQAKIYVNQYAFEPHYHGADRYIGLDPSLKENPRLIFVRDTLTIDNGLTLYTACPLRYPINSGGLEVLEDGSLQPEDFRHEQYLLMEEAGKRILISGCAHRGIQNIAGHFQPDVLIGGFHFMKITEEAFLRSAARELLSYPTTYLTGHCTGLPQYEILKEEMGSRLQALSTGRRLLL